jgi:hypothetical protein
MKTRTNVLSIPVTLIALMLALGFAGRAAEAAGPTEITACMTITESGSYVLVNNLTPAAPGDCLRIAADFVTINLNGFLISGLDVRPTGKAGYGIRTYTDAVPRAIAIHDGTVADFQLGVFLQAHDVQVERIRVVDSEFSGISIDSPFSGGAIVKDCLVSGGAHGITAEGAVISGNVVTRTKLGGIEGDRSTIVGNVVRMNSGVGVAAGRATIVNNTVSDNDAGIVASCPAAVVANAATENGLNLVTSSAGCTTAHNAAP